MDYRFNDSVVMNSIDGILATEGVDEMTITNDAVRRIAYILTIDKMEDPEDVRAVRNSVVKIFGRQVNFALGLDENGNKVREDSFKDYKYWNMWLSAVTAVCDDRIWHLGSEV